MEMPVAAEAPAAAPAGQSAAPAAAPESEAVEVEPHWSDDEKFAARGLSLKSFAHQCPDLWSMVRAL